MRMVAIALTGVLGVAPAHATTAQCDAATTAGLRQAADAVAAGRTLDPRTPDAPGKCQAARRVVALFRRQTVLVERRQVACALDDPEAVETARRAVVTLSQTLLPRYCGSKR